MNEQQNIDINVKMIQMVNQLQRLFPNHQIQVCKGYGITPCESMKSYYYAFIEGFWYHYTPKHGEISKSSRQSFTEMFDTLVELDDYLFQQISNYKKLLS